MEVNNKTLVVCVVVVGFVFGSLLLAPFLLVGAGCGFVFCWFFRDWFEPYLVKRKKKQLDEALRKVDRLRIEVYGKKE